jgi:hypothetical protein
MYKPQCRAQPSVVALVITSLLAAAVGACHDANAPEAPPAIVAIDVASLRGPTYSEDTAHRPTVLCGVDLRAIATGSGTASWRDATLRFYIGPNHQTLLDTAVYKTADIAPSWSEDGRIAAGDTEITHWDIYAGIPFHVTFEYHYVSNNTPRTASVDVACGAPAAESAPAPIVTNVTITPSTGEIEAGSPIQVSYSINAPGGAWRTQIGIAGPCDTTLSFNEARETSLTRSVSVPIRGSCALGKPIIVTVTALDALGQTSDKVQLSSTVLADHKPPSLSMWFSSPNGAFGLASFHGDVYGADSIPVDLTMADNHALSAVIWDVLPFGSRDSLLVDGTFADRRAWIHLRPEWSGPIQLRFFARDSVGLTSTPGTSPLDSAVVHPATIYPTDSATVSGETRAVAIDAKHQLLYLAQGNQHRIAVVSLATLKIVKTIDLPGSALDVDINQAGDSLAVVLWQHPTLTVVDLVPTTPVVSTLALPILDTALGETPAAVRIAANGRAYVATEGTAAGAFHLVEVNLADSSARVLPVAGESGYLVPALIERSQDGAVLAMSAAQACLRRYVVAADSFTDCVQPAHTGSMLTVDATGSRIAFGKDIYDESLQLIPRAKPYTSSSAVIPTARAPDGTMLNIAVPSDGKIRVRTSDGEIVDRLPDFVYPGILRVGSDGTIVSMISSRDFTTTTISVIHVQ